MLKGAYATLGNLDNLGVLLQLPEDLLAQWVGELGVRGGVLDRAFLSLVLNKYQGGYSPPNFRAAISCISSREMVPYMSIVVL
jgi:hypothetical protein